MEQKKFKLLLVDDEADILDSLKRTFRLTYQVFTANSGIEGIELLKAERFDLIMCDQKMPNITGDKVLKFALETQPDAVRILLTGYSDMESLVRSVNEASIYKYLTKPWEPEDLKMTVARALEHQREVFSHHKTNQVLQQTVQAYERFVPKQFLQLLNIDSIINIKLGNQTERTMTILFSDIRNFTLLSESMSPRENFNFINSYLSWVEPVIEQHQGFIDKYIGDAIMALFPDSPDDALRSAIAMLKQLLTYNQYRNNSGYRPVKIGLGLNTGMVMLGTIGGEKRMDGTVISDAVNLASRLEGMTKTYETPLLISEHTLYGLGDASQYHIRFVDRIRVKGRTTPVSVYEVFNNDELTMMQAKDATKEKFERALAYYHMQAPQQALPLLEECLAIVPEDRVTRIYIDRCHTEHHSTMHKLGSPMPWSSHFFVGIDALDQLHKALLSAMNQLMTVLELGSCDEIPYAINRISREAEALFSKEEALMQRHDYPMWQHHAYEHQKFNEYLARFATDIIGSSQDNLALRFRAQLVLLDWFSSHTYKSDRHMAQHLLNMTSE